MLGHVIDAERVFSYRALRFARHDHTPLAILRAGRLRPLRQLRRTAGWRISSRSLWRSAGPPVPVPPLSGEAWMRRGIASDNPVSVRAVAYIIAGHELHHRRVLQEKYLR